MRPPMKTVHATIAEYKHTYTKHHGMVINLDLKKLGFCNHVAFAVLDKDMFHN